MAFTCGSGVTACILGLARPKMHAVTPEPHVNAISF